MVGNRIIEKSVSSEAVVVLLIISQLIIINIQFITFTGEASSTWTQTTDIDFQNGTLNNLTINGIGPDAKLMLKQSTMWFDKTPINSPEKRLMHAMASISTTDKILLFGGNKHYGSFNDTWVFDISENRWYEKHPITSPGPKSYHVMAPIYGTDQVLLFGGEIDSRKTWLYDYSENSWTKSNPKNTPCNLTGTAMTSIYGTDKVLLFGGQWDEDFFNETWIFDFSENNWTNLKPNISPDERASHTMSNIYGTDKVVLIGGYAESMRREKSRGWYGTWVYDLSENNWDTYTSVNGPDLYTGGSLSAIYNTDKLVLYGGSKSDVSHGTVISGDTWIYDLSETEWTNVTSIIYPPAREGHTLAPVDGLSNVVLFGGYNDDQDFGDTWIFDIFPDKDRGTFVSEPMDTGYYSSFKYLNWSVEIPEQTDIRIQLRTSLTEQELKGTYFLGPDGTIGTYYSEPGEIWSGHEKERWVQFKVYMTTENLNYTPVLNEISIIYNCYPSLNSDKVSPASGNFSNQYDFYVEYLDLDNDSSKHVTVCIDDVNYLMAASDAQDNLYSDGKSYSLTKELNLGNHSYHFLASDGELQCSTVKKYLDVSAGPVRYIFVEPSKATITTDEEQLFIAKGYDTNLNQLPISPIWDTTGGGTIDHTGIFTAMTPGNWTIFANYSGISGSAAIGVLHGKLFRITITPQCPTITTDGYQIFNAVGYDAEDNIIEISPSWSVSGGGSIDRYGNFTANESGIWTVYANDSGVCGSTLINVLSGELNRLSISPENPVITTDDYQQFTAIGYDADNNTISIDAYWSVNGGGKINHFGNFSAETVGIWIVIANYSGISGRTTIIVNEGAISKIIIKPEFVLILPNESINFTALGYDGDNNEFTISPIWSVNGGGVIDDNGRFIGGTPGIWIISANHQNFSINATVRVIFIDDGNPSNNNETIDTKNDVSSKNSQYYALLLILSIIIIIVVIFLILKIRSQTNDEL
jgi:hypothetical protein